MIPTARDGDGRDIPAGPAPAAAPSEIDAIAADDAEIDRLQAGGDPAAETDPFLEALARWRDRARDDTDD